MGYYFSSARLNRVKALMYPRFVMVLFGIIVAWNIIGTIREARKEIPEKKEIERPKILEGFQKNQRAIVIFLSAVVYIFLGQVVGFWITTLVYVFLLSYYLGVRNMKYLIPQSLVVIGILYAIFRLWLKLALPKGLLF
jgi:hypothetical protein